MLQKFQKIIFEKIFSKNRFFEKSKNWNFFIFWKNWKFTKLKFLMCEAYKTPGNPFLENRPKITIFHTFEKLWKVPKMMKNNVFLKITKNHSLS